MKRHEWRAPSPEQLALEAKLAKLIKQFVQNGTATTRKPHFKVTKARQQQLEQEIAAILQQAHEMGVMIGQGMVGVQESAIGDVAKAWVDKARDIVSGIVDRVREMIGNALGKRDGEDVSTAQVIQDAIGGAVDQLPDLIAETAIPTAVEDGAMGVLKQSNVAQVVWVASPGACELCMENAEYGAVDIGSAFPNGDTQAPAHPRCRCSVVPA